MGADVLAHEYNHPKRKVKAKDGMGWDGMRWDGLGLGLGLGWGCCC